MIFNYKGEYLFLEKKPRHVFVWCLNLEKQSSKEENFFLFNTYNIANNRTISMAFIIRKRE
ncbi:unnamed protein product [Pocillopora meandrina]|uniref:Uncharacterized protein n=1 Tax=Pocillopora meandrina TaxID=46732 RepID=A0AAU9XCX8_9CNID|nr:unnamed protein product [Pocillopora meandrina]